MAKKINIDDTMDEIVSIQNQIAGLTQLLSNKKAIMARYFDKSGNRSVSNDECTCYVQERTNITYDVEALRRALSKPQFNFVCKPNYHITDWKAFISVLRDHGVEPEDIKPFILVEREVEQDKLSKLYDKGELDIKKLSGCYEATTKKSIVLKMKNIHKEIPIKE